ncbi:hypothetical protein H1R20_g5094, partial [Candolleomyces eurysporus]
MGEPKVEEPGGSAYLKVERLANIHPPKRWVEPDNHFFARSYPISYHSKMSVYTAFPEDPIPCHWPLPPASDAYIAPQPQDDQGSPQGTSVEDDLPTSLPPDHQILLGEVASEIVARQDLARCTQPDSSTPPPSGGPILPSSSGNGEPGCTVPAALPGFSRQWRTVQAVSDPRRSPPDNGPTALALAPQPDENHDNSAERQGSASRIPDTPESLIPLSESRGDEDSAEQQSPEVEASQYPGSVHSRA